jgi:hypothetical protein
MVGCRSRPQPRTTVNQRYAVGRLLDFVAGLYQVAHYTNDARGLVAWLADQIAATSHPLHIKLPSGTVKRGSARFKLPEGVRLHIEGTGGGGADATSVNGRWRDGLDRASCEVACKALPVCVGFSFTNTNVGRCFLHGEGLDSDLDGSGYMYHTPSTVWHAFVRMNSVVESSSGTSATAPFLVSRFKPAFQSYASRMAVASRAVDGDLEQSWYTRQRFCRTPNQVGQHVWFVAGIVARTQASLLTSGGKST